MEDQEEDGTFILQGYEDGDIAVIDVLCLECGESVYRAEAADGAVTTRMSAIMKAVSVHIGQCDALKDRPEVVL